MKIFRFSVLVVSIVVLLTSCKQSPVPSKDERVIKAIDVLSEGWSKEYNDLSERWDEEYIDKYLEITNTKIVNIKNEIDSAEFPIAAEYFKDIDYIVEFDLISNYFNTSPYYSNFVVYNCVVVLKDGTMSLEYRSPLHSFRAASYSTDFSPFIESIEEFHGEYDQIIKIE